MGEVNTLRVPKKDVVPGDNRPLSKKDYSLMLVAYSDQTLKPSELKVYRAIKDSLVEKYKISTTNDLMMLDMACYDYIRIKRLQKMISDEGDVVTVNAVSKAGSAYSFRKVHEASYLLNAVETQFRNNMKELMLTKREQMKIQIGKETVDFSKYIETEGTVVDDE